MRKDQSYKGVLVPRLVDTGRNIDEFPEESIQYQHSIFCQLSLPRSKAEGLIYERRYNGASIAITAGRLWDGRQYVQQELPYGAKPRLILAHISTEAVQKRTRIIDLDGSIARFMERIGLQSNGSHFVMFKKQIKALAAAEFALGFTNANNQAETQWRRPIESFKAWTTVEGKQGVLWPAELELSDQYYKDLLNHAVPLDARALSALKHSALAIDAYCFIAKRLHVITKPTRISYKHFHEQFGQEYKSLKHFAHDWKKAIATAKFVYPMAQIKPDKGGLVLEPSPPPISGQTPKLVK